MASNPLRIVLDNAVDRATLTASSEAGNLHVGNLLSDIRSSVWRSMSTEDSVEAVFKTTTAVSVVSLPLNNLSSTAKMRVQAFNTANNEVYDSGFIYAAKPAPFADLGWGSRPLGANFFTTLGTGEETNSYASHWLPSAVYAKRVVVTLSDPDSKVGYLEAARLVIGHHWAPKISASLGVQLGLTDTSKHYRTDSGDSFTTAGVRYRTLSFSLGMLGKSEASNLLGFLRDIPLSKAIYVSVFPDGDSSTDEQAYQLFGKLSKSTGTTLYAFNSASLPITLEEI